MLYKVLLTGDAKSVWAIVLPNGTCPAEDFFETLQESDYKKLLKLLQRTTQVGLPTNTQKFKKLRGDIFEFKSFQDRLLCFFLPGEIIVVTHGVKKKRDRANPGEIDRAERLCEEFLARWKE